MKCSLLFLLSVIFPLTLFAQTELTHNQIREDYTVLKNILEEGHPALYEYTTHSQWDSIFTSFEQEIEKLKTADNLFRSISALANQVKDGHLIIHHPKMETIPPMFPLLVKIIDQTFYTDTDDFGISVGSEIISVNGISSDELLQRMLKYAPSDGYNLTKKYRQVESEFGILLYYEFGAKDDYTVIYRTPENQLKTDQIPSQPFESIGPRSANRNSYFAAYHKQKDQTTYAKNTIGQKWPFVHFMDSVQTAVLTVNSFALDPKEFKSKLIAIFNDIEKKKADHLVIDVRQNNGGFRANAIHLFSFITEEPFKQRTSESVVTTALPEKEHIMHSMSDYGQFLENYFAQSEIKNGQLILSMDRAEGMMKPYKKTFNGKVYVLTGGKTFSAGSAFALNAKNDSEIVLVGEETGGGYYFHTGQFPVLYELPHSKIMVNMSLVKINHYVEDTAIPKGSGVLPDVEVNLTVQDLIAGTDTQLDYVIKEIHKE